MGEEREPESEGNSLVVIGTGSVERVHVSSPFQPMRGGAGLQQGSYYTKTEQCDTLVVHPDLSPDARASSPP